MKKDPVEELHFRVDEHERKFADISRVAESIPALIEGGVSALHAGMKAELAKIVAGQAEDTEADRAVAKRLDTLVEKLDVLCEKLALLVHVLASPTTRESTIDLPSGPVHMTVRERKN